MSRSKPKVIIESLQKIKQNIEENYILIITIVSLILLITIIRIKRHNKNHKKAEKKIK